VFGVGKVWTKKFFNLNGDALYYSQNKGFSHTAKKICMVNVTIRQVEIETKRQYSFAIFDSEKNPVCVLAADTEQDATSWICALNRVKDALRPLDFKTLSLSDFQTKDGSFGLSPEAGERQPLALMQNPVNATFAKQSESPPDPSTASASTPNRSKSSAAHLSQVWTSVIPNHVPARNQPDFSIDDRSAKARDEHIKKKVAALVKMGYPQADGIEALDICNGSLDEAVIRLARRSSSIQTR
jgi:hypothetical protein